MNLEKNKVELNQPGVQMQMHQTDTGGARVRFKFGGYKPVEVTVPADAVDRCARAFELVSITLGVWGKT